MTAAKEGRLRRWFAGSMAALAAYNLSYPVRELLAALLLATLVLLPLSLLAALWWAAWKATEHEKPGPLAARLRLARYRIYLWRQES